MFRICLLFGVLVAVKCIAKGNNENSLGTARDSYLNAYAVTKKLKEKSDIDYYPDDVHPVYNGGYDPHYYGPPKPIYGPPVPYPPQNYGPYPPAPPPNYGPPEPFIPHALLGILDKIKYKIDLLTIGKIILKLLIFKKIVSWIAVICLLLFLPTLKKKHMNNHNGGDDLLRSFNNEKHNVDDKINNITTFVMDSIEAFSRKQNQTSCQSIYCKTQKLRNYIDDKLTYGRLVEFYSKDL